MSNLLKKEFSVEDWLDDHPAIYALLVTIFLLTLLSTAVGYIVFTGWVFSAYGAWGLVPTVLALGSLIWALTYAEMT